jgi:segregation and condensation protein B
MELPKIVEALLFATQEPLSLERMVAAVKDSAKDIKEACEVGEGGVPTPEAVPEWIAPLLTVDELQVREAIDALVAHYDGDGRAFTIVERSHGWRLCAKGEYAEWCRALYPGKKPHRLSQPALETLAIIAYRQPITRAGIEAVRGVSVDTMVQQLVDRGLIKIEGRADLPGKPLLYGTTDAFLDHFAVKTLDELPNASELRRIKLPTPEEEQPGAPARDTQLSLDAAAAPDSAAEGEAAAEEPAAEGAASA